MYVDGIERDDWSLRYHCTCGFVSIPANRPKLELLQRIHRHRHRVGLAGIYHHPPTTEGHDT